MAEARFHWADYLVLGISLFVSCTVGVYYAIMDWKRKRNTTEDFLMAGRKMSIVPVAVSLLVTWLSSISFMGNPVEIYYFGVMAWLLALGQPLALPLVAEFLAPIYHKMKVVSVYQVKITVAFF